MIYGESDRKITQKIKEAGVLMDIQLFDRLIVIQVEVKQCGENKLDLYYYSLVTLL